MKKMKNATRATRARLWLTQADLDRNLRDHGQLLAAAAPKPGRERKPAADVLRLSVAVAGLQKHQALHICLWALREFPELVGLSACV